MPVFLKSSQDNSFQPSSKPFCVESRGTRTGQTRNINVLAAIVSNSSAFRMESC